MPRYLQNPSIIEAPGTPTKRIEEFFGAVNSGTSELSIAKMTSPQGWTEPGQTPAFDEYTLVLDGCLQVESKESVMEVRAGQAIHCSPGEWIRYSTPFPGGASYVAVCLPAFSPDTVHRYE